MTVHVRSSARGCLRPRLPLARCHRPQLPGVVRRLARSRLFDGPCVPAHSPHVVVGPARQRSPPNVLHVRVGHACIAGCLNLQLRPWCIFWLQGMVLFWHAGGPCPEESEIYVSIFSLGIYHPLRPTSLFSKPLIRTVCGNFIDYQTTEFDKPTH